MTKTELMKLAVAVAEAEHLLYAWKMRNVPSDAAERIRQNAEYRIVQSRLHKAQAEYNAAIAALSGAELEQIMREET